MELPNGWISSKLEDVCDICDNLRKPINSAERVNRISGKGQSELYPYYGATGLVGYIDDYLTDGEYVLLGEDAAPFLDFSKDVAYLINGKTWVNNHAHILLSYFNNKYLLHFLNQFNYKNYVSGTTRLKLTQTSMKNMPIRVAPLAEQHRIVAKIEELFSSLDKGIGSLKTAQAQLKIYRQAVLKWAFEGKLTNENVKDEELPEGWKCVDFGSLFMGTPQNGLYKPSSEYGSGTPILRIDGFYDGQLVTDYDFKRVRLSSDEISKYLLSPNDIVVNRVNSMAYLGKCGLVNALKEKTVFESNVMKIQLDIKKSIPRYITYFLSSLRGVKELTKNAKQAVNQASINQTDVANAQIPLAPITEQSCIVSEIEKRLSVCDKLEESITQSLSQAEALRQSILKKAFEGKLVPQDPNDEPASMLLERIRAERANSTPIKKTRTPKEKK